MRNSDRMLKIIQELLEKATNKLTADFRKEQLKKIKLDCDSRLTSLRAFREKEKGQTYEDANAKERNEARAENIGAILTSLKSKSDLIAKEETETNNAIESFSFLQLKALEEAEALKADVKKLRESVINLTEEFQAPLNNEITTKAKEMASVEDDLKNYAEKLATLLIAKAELSAERKMIKQSVAKLTETARESRIVSVEKIIAETAEAEMESIIDGLKEKMDTLKKDPTSLAEKLIRLVKDGATEDEISKEMNTLRILAGDVPFDFNATPKIGLVASPLEKTAGALKDQISFYENSVLSLQQNAINNTMLISKMVAGIVYYMELTNKAKIVRAQLAEEMKLFEKEFTKLPSIRANINKIDGIIAGLEETERKIFKSLEDSVSYSKENAIKQCSTSFMESQARINLSKLESSSKFATPLDEIEITVALLRGAYSSLDEKEPEISTTPEDDFLGQFAGETYPINEAPRELDLKNVDPNALGLDNNPTMLPVIEEIKITDLPDYNSQGIAEVPKKLKENPPEEEMPIEPIAVASPIVREPNENSSLKAPEPVETAHPLPASVIESEGLLNSGGPAVPVEKPTFINNEEINPASVMEREGLLNSDNPIIPAPRVTNIRNVGINGDIITKAYIGYMESLVGGIKRI